MTCRCKVCLYYEEFSSRIDLLPVEHQDFFYQMYDKLCYREDEVAQCRAIIEGTWPNADEIIKRKREKHAVHSSGKQ
jgi:hypothetical protein